MFKFFGSADTSLTIDLFDQEAFLEANTDLREILSSGQYSDIEDYLQKAGYTEMEEGTRSFHKDFQPYNGLIYGEMFPDVEEATREGEFTSKFDHFCKYGYSEIIKGDRVWERNSEKPHSPENLRAHIDRYENSLLTGWVFDPIHPNSTLTVEIFIDEKCAGEVLADIDRSDLETLFESDGRHGFSFAMDNHFKSKTLGLVTLREKESEENITTNRFSIRYDLDSLFGDQEQIDSALSHNTSESFHLHHLAMEHYRSHHFEKAKQIIETSLKNGEKIPDILYMNLLAIYFAEENYLNSIELYRLIIESSELKHLHEMLHKETLSHCSSLWMSNPGEYLSSKDTHKLEVLLIVLGNIVFSDEVSPPEKSQNLYSFLSYSLKSGILFDEESIKKLFEITVEYRKHDDSGEEVDLYAHHLPLIEQLLVSVHTVDHSRLDAINDEISTLSEQTMNPLAKEILHLYLLYVEVLINSRRLNKEDTRVIIKLLEKQISTHINEYRLNIIYMDLFYILGDDTKALSLLMSYADNISYLDWKCLYLPDILWLYFKKNDYQIANEGIKKLLYRHQKESRATYVEHVMILADINRWKESVNTGLLYSTVNHLILGSFTDTCKEISHFAEKIMDELLLGTISTYSNQSRNLKEYFSGLESNIALNFHDCKLFELQNLYYLSIYNSDKNNNFAVDIDQKYIGLLSKERRELLQLKRQNRQEEPKIAVLTVVSDRYEEKYVDYYKSMLLFSKNRDIQIYLYSSRYYYLLKLEDDVVRIIKKPYHENTAIKLLNEYACDMYIILSPDTIVHHNVSEALEFDKDTYYISSEDEYSFSLTAKQFKYFQNICERHLYTNMFDYMFDFRIKLVEYIGLGHIGYTAGRHGVLSFQNIEIDKIDLLTNYNYSIFELNNVEKSLSYLTDLYLDKRIKDIISINIDDVSIDLLKPFEIEEREEDLACFLVQRNEYFRLEGFLSYYRELGVAKFYIIDNASDDDKTLDYLLDQDDVEVYSTVQAYSQSLFGVKWIELLIQTKRIGKWNIVVDADELLFLDDQFSTLQDLCSELDTQGFDSLYAPFLDMYSKAPINQTTYSQGRDILKTCAYHDKHFYTLFTPYGGTLGEMNTYQGGLRSRAFGLNSVVLNKLPLFKFDPKHKLREGLHWIDNASPAYGKSILLHFKYIETFHQYVINEIKRGQHWNGASEYWQYYHFLTANPDFSLYDPMLSKEFTSVEAFYQNMFMPFTLNHPE